jgi:O-acetyl-ADP-ribose deacetylase (regulator of RNase III)
MKVIEGDLVALALEGEFDVIVHGANCQCTMGAGIARTIKKMLPEAFEADLETTKGDRAKLGTISTGFVQRGDVKFVVVNGYTQFHYRGSGRRVDYDAIRRVFVEVRRSFSGHRIGYPRIGAGLGGGDWSRISSIINEALDGEDHTLVEFVPQANSKS